MLLQWARELGRRVSEVETYPADEFAEWLASQRIDPTSEERMDLRFAMVCTMIANALRGKNSKPAKMEDFLLFREKHQQTPEEMMHEFQMAILQADMR